MDKTLPNKIVYHPLDSAKDGDVTEALKVCKTALEQIEADLPLDAYCKEYLTTALQQILRGVPVNEAMLLKRKRGKAPTRIDVAFDVYNRVEETRHNEGVSSYEDAYGILESHEWVDGKPRKCEMIRRIHKDTKQLLEKSEREMDKWFKDYPPFEHEEL